MEVEDCAIATAFRIMDQHADLPIAGIDRPPFMGALRHDAAGALIARPQRPDIVNTPVGAKLPPRAHDKNTLSPAGEEGGAQCAALEG